MVARSLALLVLAAGGVFAGMFYLGAEPDVAVAYPRGYRQWVHVKSALVGPQSPFYERFGGLHHIYANEKAMEGYPSGKFPNGSVLVFDVFETREETGTTIEGPRRFIDVMKKDDKRFAATGGWGFEEFKGDSQTERTLTTDAAQKCHNCHARAKDNDSVFSRFRK